MVSSSAIILEQVSKTTIQLILKEPFYGHFFTGIIREVSSYVPTMAIGTTSNRMLQLYINPQFWEYELDTSELRYGLLKHEILHIVLKHIFQIGKYSNKKIFNIAADIVVNQYIEKKQLPEGAVLISDFSSLSLELNKDVGYYYEKLIKEWNDIGSFLGVESNAYEKLPSQQKKFVDLMNKGGWQFEMHDSWITDLQKLPESDKKIIERLLIKIVETSIKRVGPKHIGTLPAGVQYQIGQIMESMAPSFDWKRALRVFAGNSTRTYIKNTISKPSKRYGSVPGIKIKNRKKILVAIDTSRSIDLEELMEFFNELYYIWRQKTEICVVECDTKIHNTYMYKGQLPNTVHGRGGTNFNEPIAYANEKYIADAIIYFTDGFGNTPVVKNRKPIMWVISSKGINNTNVLWDSLSGQKIKIHKKTSI